MLTSLVFIILFHFVFCIHAKHDVVVVLGSSDERILQERVSAAIQYIQTTDTPIILFISGGVKNAILAQPSELSESVKAAEIIANNPLFDTVQIVLDEHATNTAENFAYLKQWAHRNFSVDDFPDFVITTSDFHQMRAQLLFQGILPDITPKWNLSKSSCIRCWTDEHIHIKNVQVDVLKASMILM